MKLELLCRLKVERIMKSKHFKNNNFDIQVYNKILIKKLLTFF